MARKGERLRLVRISPDERHRAVMYTLRFLSEDHRTMQESRNKLQRLYDTLVGKYARQEESTLILFDEESVLSYYEEYPDATQKDVMTHFGVSRYNLKKVLDTLEEKGIITVDRGKVSLKRS